MTPPELWPGGAPHTHQFRWIRRRQNGSADINRHAGITLRLMSTLSMSSDCWRRRSDERLDTFPELLVEARDGAEEQLSLSACGPAHGFVIVARRSERYVSEATRHHCRPTHVCLPTAWGAACFYVLVHTVQRQTSRPKKKKAPLIEQA